MEVVMYAEWIGTLCEREREGKEMTMKPNPSEFMTIITDNVTGYCRIKMYTTTHRTNTIPLYVWSSFYHWVSGFPVTCLVSCAFSTQISSFYSTTLSETPAISRPSISPNVIVDPENGMLCPWHRFSTPDVSDEFVCSLVHLTTPFRACSFD
jgi:hypothetical protein